MEKKSLYSGKQQLVITVEASLYTKENVVA